METNSTCISVDYEAASKLAGTISLLVGEENGSEFLTSCHELIEKADTFGLIGKILSQQEAIFASELDSDTECTFQALALFLFKEEDGVQAVVQSICDALTASTDVKPRLRLKILVSLFNLLLFPLAKYTVLKSIFTYANSTRLSSLVSSFHSRVEGWAESWKLSAAEKRELFLLVASTLEEDNKLSDALQFLVKYLDTYVGETFPPSAQQIATNAVVNSIKAPVGAFKYRTILQESLASQQLGSAELTDLMTLLTILCEGSLSDYKTYASSKSGVMQTHAIDQDVVLSNMRLLSLCGLCAEVQTISYAKIAEVLDVTMEEVEMWVVMAIGEDLVEATMDQAKEEVTVTRATARRFGKEQWKTLRDKLKEWHSGMTDILNAMQ